MDCGIQIFRREDIVKNVQERLTQERETGMWGKPEYQTGKQTPQDRELELISLEVAELGWKYMCDAMLLRNPQARNERMLRNHMQQNSQCHEEMQGEDGLNENI